MIRRVPLAAVALLAAGCTLGASPNVSPPPTGTPPPAAVSQRWTGTMRSTTFHDLYVGGRCTTVWSTTLRLRVMPGGSVTGAGRTRLTDGPACSFPIAQLQIRTIVVEVVGTVAHHAFQLRLTEVSHEPSTGADDYGGFRATLLSSGKRLVISVPLRGAAAASARGVFSTQVPGPDRDTFGSQSVFRLSCVDCVGA